MDVRRRILIALLVVAASVGAGCTRDLEPATMPTTGSGGASGAAGSGGRNSPPTDARAKVDSLCQYDVDAVHVSTENTSDACLYSIAPPDADVPVDAFRIIVDGVQLPQDSTNGWTYTDATQRVFRIVGPTCDAVKAGAVQTVWVEWYCSGIP
jgi:hypothetical protein